MAETGAVIVKIDTDELMNRIRPYLAKAWDEGYSWCFGEHEDVRSLDDNPYRDSE